jgi:hypothetical protein
MTGPTDDDSNLPATSSGAKIGRGILQIVGGAIPFAGGALAAIAGAWSESEQEKVNRFLEHWMLMLKDELREKEQTIVEIMSRLDLSDEVISERLESPEYQALIRKTFREWSGAESEDKRVYIRNILANAASTRISSDDVVRMFISWVEQYSELHFHVIEAIYNSADITRGGIWRKIGKGAVREDSADADLFKLLFRDLSTGGVIRQFRQRDYAGNFQSKTRQARPKGSGPKLPVSAFDDDEGYELTDLGQQFVHYAMTDLPTRIEAPGDVKPE